ncbi:MAG TPA: GAF domain-containing protein [Chloroflexota bacterium]
MVTRTDLEELQRRNGALQADLERTQAQLHSLLEASLAVVSSLTLHDVLQTVLAGVRALFDARAAAVWRRDDSGRLRRLASSGLSRASAREVAHQQPDGGVTAQVVQTGQPVAVADMRQQPEIEGGDALEDEGIRSLLSAPLFSEGQPIGALNVYLPEPHQFTAAEVGLLVSFANQAAAAIEQALERARTKRALAEVSHQKEVLDAIVRHAEDGIVALDSAGCVVLFSPSCERLIGPRAREAIGKPLHAVLDCHDEDGHCQLQAVLAAGTPNAYVETLIRVSGGQERWFGATIARARGGPAHEVRWVIVLRDVTASRELVRMKSELLSTVSHELRTPLTSIRALSELLTDHEFAPEEVQVLSGTINREAERLGRLVQNVLDAARLDAGTLPNHPRPVDVATLVTEALALPRHLAPERIFQVDIPGRLPPVEADPDRLRQVIDNLLSNALKFSPIEMPIAIRAGQHGQQVRLSISDHGPGVADEQQPLLFRRFGGLPSGAPGVGLGLYLTRELMTLLHGQVGYESRPGRGATFWITLPLVAT